MFDLITSIVESAGYAGIAFLMLLENIFPPIPSEIIMPLAGFAAARGDLNLFLVVAAGTLGSMAGGLFWFYAGWWLGRERLKRLAARYGRWMTVGPAEIDGAAEWFSRHSGKSVLIGRVIPAVRTLISVPAGVTRMPLSKFLAYSSLGTSAWTGLLAGAGFFMGEEYEKTAEWMNPASNIVIGVVLVFYFYRVVTFRRKSVD